MANTKIQSEQIADSAITTDRIAADAITTAKIADSVALGGSPTTTTQSGSDNSTKIATTEYVTSAISSLIDSAPSTLNTLNEIAAALNDDANFNTTVTNSIAAKLPLAGGTMTGALNMGTQNITNAGTIASGAITSTGSSTFTSTGVMDINLVANPPELNFEDTSSTSGTKRARWTLDDNNFSAQGLADDDGSVTQSLLNFNLSSGAATFGGTISSGDITVKTSADNAVNQGLRIERSNNSDTGFINYQGGAFRMVATDGDPIRFGHVSDSNEVSIHTDGKLLAGVTSAGARSAHTLARTGAFAAEILQQQTSAGASVLGLTYDGAAPNNTSDYFIYAIDNAGIKYRLHSDGSSIQSGGITAGASTFNGTVNLASGTLSLRGDAALDHDGSSLYIKAPSAIYLYPNNTNRGNISATGVLTLTSSSGTHTFGSSATNLVADFVSTDGTAAIRLRDNGGNVELSTASGNFQVQPAGGSAVFTVASSGGFTSTGLFTNTYGNGNVAAPNTSNHASGTRQVYYDSSATAWYARGIESNTLWDNTDQDWKLYRQGAVRLHWDESTDSFIINGVREYRKAIYLNNNVAYTFDIDVKNIGASGQVLEVFAGYTHYSTSYAAVIKQVWTQRSTAQSDVVIVNNTVSLSTSTGGAWSFTYVDADTVRLTKSAGTYGGGGYGYIAIRGTPA